MNVGVRGRIGRVVVWTLVGVAVVYILAPLVIVVFNSFNSVAFNQFPPPGFSLKWYANVFRNPTFGPAAALSLIYGVLAALLAVIVGTLGSYALVRGRIWGKIIVLGLIAASLVVPKMVLGVGLFVFFSEADVYGQSWTVVVAHATIALPFVVAVVSAGLTGLDPMVEEAGLDLGRSSMMVFLKVVIPQVRVPIIIGGIFAFIISFDQLESTIFLTRPGSETLPIAMLDYTIQSPDPTIAALSTLMIGVSVLAVVVVALMMHGSGALRLLGSAREQEIQEAQDE